MLPIGNILGFTPYGAQAVRETVRKAQEERDYQTELYAMGSGRPPPAAQRRVNGQMPALQLVEG